MSGPSNTLIPQFRMSGRRRKGRRPSTLWNIRRITIVMLFTLAWAWIVGGILILWHGVGSGNTTASTTTTTALGGTPLIHQRQLQKPPSSSSSTLAPYESPLLIFTCNRDEYLQRTLNAIYKYLPSTTTSCKIGCPIIVSQDGTNVKVVKVIQEFQEKFASHNVPLIHIQHPATTKLRGNAYMKLAVHYGWALEKVFEGRIDYNSNNSNNPSGKRTIPPPQRVLILEEDIEIAPDFFSYFGRMAPLLDSDSTLLAISAFNDNGKDGKVTQATRLVRSDFFPGLGWMMTRKLWVDELASKWPTQYWDDWLREPAQRKGRQVIRPEVPRTFHFGTKGGASNNQYGGHLNAIKLNTENVDWSKQDLSYLEDASVFNRQYWELVSAAHLMPDTTTALNEVTDHNVRLEYANLDAFEYLAHSLQLMKDAKAGVPRTAYKGIVETRPKGNHILFLTPPLDQVRKDLNIVQR